MTSDKAECVECGKETTCVLLQLCIPAADEDLPHDLVDNFMVCRPCLKKQGTLGMWMDDILRHHRAGTKK